MHLRSGVPSSSRGRKCTYKLLWILNNTCYSFVYQELGRYPLAIVRKIRLFKHWIKLKRSNNCILKFCYENMLQNKDDWLMKVKEADMITSETKR